MAEQQLTSQTDRDLQVGRREDKRKDSVLRGLQLHQQEEVRKHYGVARSLSAFTFLLVL